MRAAPAAAVVALIALVVLLAGGLAASSRAADAPTDAAAPVSPATAAPAIAPGYKGPNLVVNPTFTQGKDGLEGWQRLFPEPNETKYAGNHVLVNVVDAPERPGQKAACLYSSPEVAPSAGVKLSSAMIPVDGTGAYRFGADFFRADETDFFIFLETYRLDPERTEQGADAYAGYVRVGRVDAHPTEIVQGKWGTSRRDMFFGKLNKRYRPTHVMIKIYCYYPPGKTYATNVYLHQIHPDDVKAATGKRIVNGSDGKKYKLDEHGKETDKRQVPE